MDGGFRGPPFEHLPGAGRYEQNIIWLHLDIVRFGLKEFLHRDWRLRQSRGCFANDACATKFCRRVRATGKCNRLQHAEMAALHQKAAGPQNVADYIDNVRLPDAYSVAGKDRNVAFGMIFQIPRYRHRNRSLATMSNSGALPSLVCESTCSGDEIEKPLIS